MTQERPFWNPYAAGVVLGLVLLSTYLLMGYGLGGSSASTRVAVGAAHLIAPATIEANSYFAQYVGPGKSVLQDWMVFEALGVILGGVFGAYSGGRMHWGAVEKGPRISRSGRLAMALTGGMIMGFAARLARGCTSGQALTGGSVLAVGSWVFMIALFVGGYAVAPMIRRAWK